MEQLGTKEGTTDESPNSSSIIDAEGHSEDVADAKTPQ